MDVGIRAARDQIAQERLVAEAEKLAARYGLQEPLRALEATRRGPQSRDPLLAAMLQREAMADLLAANNAAADQEAAKPAAPKGRKG